MSFPLSRAESASRGGTGAGGAPTLHKLFPHGELDRALDVGVENPERFEAIADEVIGKLDREDSDLEVSDPQSWRRGSTDRKSVV